MFTRNWWRLVLIPATIVLATLAACAGVKGSGHTGPSSSQAEVCPRDNGYSPFAAGTAIAHGAHPTTEMQQINSTPALAGLRAKQLTVIGAYSIGKKAPVMLEVLSMNGAKGQLAPETLMKVMVWVRLHLANEVIPVLFTDPQRLQINYCASILSGTAYVIVTADRHMVNAMGSGVSIDLAHHFATGVIAARGATNRYDMTTAAVAVMCESTLRITLTAHDQQGISSSQVRVGNDLGWRSTCISLGRSTADKDVRLWDYRTYVRQGAEVLEKVSGKPEVLLYDPDGYAALP